MKIAPVKPEIKFSELEKLDVRVGTILKVEDIEKSDKLVKLTVDLGEETTRTVPVCAGRLVGMKKERENCKEIEGLQALFVVNLPLREMMGIKSEAMLYDIGAADGITPVLSVPEKPVPNGTRVG